MVSTPTISAPGGFVPQHALAFRSADGGSTVVDAGNPLPVGVSTAPATSVALAGTATTSGAVGPLLPQLGRAIWVTLSGSWTGTVQLLRSVDGGATRLPLTYGDGSARPVWSANMQAAVADESVAAASYYLAITLTSGSLGYRVEQ
jgi:hypothetical protein